jgi:dihydrofolate synthase/folylpolyglutamate synthase
VIADRESAIAYLDRHIGQGVKPGLERIRAVLDLLAEPEAGYPIIHVAGTNGKTSTARMAARLLSSHGLTPGTFTSPHLQEIEERFEHGLIRMSPDQLVAAMAELAPIVDLAEERLGEGITYFEITAALAFSWFAERAVDAAVVETGLGGRLDATNAAESDVAVVTTIGLEHTAWLGDTIEAIAGEKLAILDPGAVLVTGDLPEEAIAVAERVAAERGSSWFRHGIDFEPAEVDRLDGAWLFDLRTPYGVYSELEMRLHGRHQVDNFAVAVAAVEALFGRALDEAGVREAAATVVTPGRMEMLRDDPPLMLDGAHNRPAMEALTEALRSEYPRVRWQVVLGVMVDKDLDGMLDVLADRVAGVHTAAAASGRARDAADVAARVTDRMDVPAHAHDSVAAALGAAMAGGDPVLVTGSLYVVGEARNALGLG